MSVQLDFVLSRLIQRSFGSFIDVSEELAGSSSTDRKKKILDYALDTRKQFIRLFALLKWSENSKYLNDCLHAISLIEEKDLEFAKVADFLYQMHNDLKIIKEPRADIENAVDVLLTGRYQQLPEIIRNTFDKSAKELDTSQLYPRIHNLIKRRLRIDILPFEFRRTIKLENGLVEMSGLDSFKLKLSIFSMQDPWVLTDLEFLKLHKPNDFQVAKVIEAAQEKLVQVKNSEIELAGENDMAIDKTSSSGASLIELYDYLLNLDLKFSLESIHCQCLRLSSMNYKNLNFKYENEQLKLDIWNSKSDEILVFIKSDLNSEFIEKISRLSVNEMAAWAHIYPEKCYLYDRSIFISYILDSNVEFRLDTMDFEAVLQNICIEKAKFKIVKLSEFLVDFTIQETSLFINTSSEYQVEISVNLETGRYQVSLRKNGFLNTSLSHLEDAINHSPDRVVELLQIVKQKQIFDDICSLGPFYGLNLQTEFKFSGNYICFSFSRFPDFCLLIIQENLEFQVNFILLKKQPGSVNYDILYSEKIFPNPIASIHFAEMDQICKYCNLKIYYYCFTAQILRLVNTDFKEIVDGKLVQYGLSTREPSVEKTFVIPIAYCLKHLSAQRSIVDCFDALINSKLGNAQRIEEKSLLFSDLFLLMKNDCLYGLIRLKDSIDCSQIALNFGLEYFKESRFLMLKTEFNVNAVELLISKLRPVLELIQIKLAVPDSYFNESLVIGELAEITVSNGQLKFTSSCQEIMVTKLLNLKPEPNSALMLDFASQLREKWLGLEQSEAFKVELDYKNVFKLVLNKKFCLDFYLKDDWIGVFDASFQSKQYSRFPGFATSVCDIASRKPVYYSFLSNLAIEKTSLVIHNGLVAFDAKSLVLEKVFEYLKLISFAIEFESIAKEFAVEKVHVELLNLRIAYVSPLFYCTISISPVGRLGMRLKLRDYKPDESMPITATEVSEFEVLMNEKLSSVAVSKEWIKFLFKWTLLPRIAQRDLIQVVLLEKSSDLLKTRLSFSELAPEIDLENTRVCLDFEFADRNSGQTFDLTVKYNYSSGVLINAKAKVSESDLTLVPKESPFLQQKLSELATTESLSKMQIIDRVLIAASTRVISARGGGPGKLYPTLKALASRALNELRNK